MVKINAREIDAVVRCLDGLTDVFPEAKVEIERQDSLGNVYEDGFLIVRVDKGNGRIFEDAISEDGQVSSWTVDTEEEKETFHG